MTHIPIIIPLLMVKSCESPHEKSPFCWCFHSAAQLHRLLTWHRRFCWGKSMDIRPEHLGAPGTSSHGCISDWCRKISPYISLYIYILWLYVYIEVEIELYSIHIYIYVCVCELSGLYIYIYMCTYIGCLVLYDLSSNMVSWKIQHLNRCFSRIFQYWNVRLYMISWHQTCSS